ncbi:hypothetical protein CUMW_066640, partial [Citrus unshiu]
MSSFNKVTLLLALHFVSYTSVNNASLMNPKVHVNIFNKTLFYCSFKWIGLTYMMGLGMGAKSVIGVSYKMGHVWPKLILVLELVTNII